MNACYGCCLPLSSLSVKSMNLRAVFTRCSVKPSVPVPFPQSLRTGGTVLRWQLPVRNCHDHYPLTPRAFGRPSDRHGVERGACTGTVSAFDRGEGSPGPIRLGSRRPLLGSHSREAVTAHTRDFRGGHA